MNRAQLEHVVRAAGLIADDREIVVVGSMAVLGQFPAAPAELLVSVEADVYPRNHPERADVIDGSIGEGSPFHTTFGYYAQGVGVRTAVLPHGWEARLVLLQGESMAGVTGLCLEIHDLLISKLVAGREKDLEFARVALACGLARAEVLRERLAETELEPRLREAVRVRILRSAG